MITRGERGRAPVFVVGCPRSGTTLLYHMLLSAGGFAYYRAETHVFNTLVRRFGNLQTVADRERLMEKWLGSVFYRRSGLDSEQIRARVRSECHNGGDFLRLVMGGIAARQGVSRWADCTPQHVLHMSEIKETIPEALFVHIIRDGRDVALSLDRAGWVAPFPWDGGRKRLVAGLRWEWVVNKGREDGARLGPDYLEVSFEDVVTNPQETLTQLGLFIEHDLEYERIQRDAVGSVKRPNTSFEGEAREGSFNPVGRWRAKYPKDELAVFEMMIGRSLKELGYELSSGVVANSASPGFEFMRSGYRAYFETKQWVKVNTPLSRFMADIEMLSE